MNRWMALLPLVALACSKTVTLSPELDTKFQRATALVRSDDKNQFPEAERLLQEVITAEPKYKDAVLWKAQMLIAWSDSLQQEALLLTDAEKELGHLVERAAAKTEKAETPEAEAFAQMLVTNISERHAKVAATLKQWRLDAAGHQKRGFDLIEAEIAGKPNPSYKVHRILADYYRIKGDVERARQELDKVRQTNPDSTGLHFLTGVMKLKVDKDYDGAVASMEKALAKDDGFVKALYYKGLALAAKDDDAAAEKAMQAVLAKSSNHLGAKTYLDISNVVQQAAADLTLEKLPTK